MQITPVSSLYQASFEYDEELAEKRKHPLSSGTGKGDTATFSEEGRLLAAAMASRKTLETGQGEDAGNSSGESGKDKNGPADGSGVAGLSGNDEDSMKKELLKEIQRVEREVQDLGEELEGIMGAEMPFDEKLRLSQPVQKRLQDRLMDLSSLKAQAQAMATPPADPASKAADSV